MCLAPERVERGLETKAIEIAPLAFMRGRTLSHSIVILDEAQNCTAMQMKMFLTRLGEGSKMIITGDPRRWTCRLGSRRALPTRWAFLKVSKGSRMSLSRALMSSGILLWAELLKHMRQSAKLNWL